MKTWIYQCATLAAFVVCAAGFAQESTVEEPAPASPGATEKPDAAPPGAAEQRAQPSEGTVAPPRITNSIGMELQRIVPGSFMMGSTKGDANEAPPHRVTITKSFYIGVHEVTQAEWEALMGDNPSHFKEENRPVENVTWKDAELFCRRLSEKEGIRYRLPTEAEWEYACRAGTTTEFPWGDQFQDEYAWCDQNSENESHPVGMKRPNPWGLYDMSGNVYEWCADSYAEYTDQDQTDPLVSLETPYHVDRGGCWYNVAEYCRSSDRGGRLADFRDFFVGLRVVCEK